MARDVISWVDKIPKTNDELNIHCFKGQSRSVAMAMCLNTYINVIKYPNKKDFLKNIKNLRDDAIPNADVMRILSKEMIKTT